MTISDAAFVGSVPENHDRYLASVLFDPYADDLAARLTVTDGIRVGEVACGTGLVTRRLVERLGGRGTVVATDLNAAMIAHGRTRMAAGAPVEWRPADGTSLPLPDRAFGAVAEARAAVAARIAARLGDRPVRTPLRATVCTARRSAA